MIAVALFLFLAAVWCWSIAAPAWGMPVGAVLFVVATVLLGRDSDREETTDA